MSVPNKCDVCGDRHHAHQAHRFVKPTAVSVARATLEYMRAGGTFVASVAPAYRMPKPRVAADLTSGGRLPLGAKCGVCGAKFSAKRSDARFCSAKCRQASSRKRRAK